MNYTVWTLLVDVGIISALLMLGKLFRAKVKFIQKLFLPPSLIAGFVALILGPEVLRWLPLSENCGTYSGLLIAMVFGCIPFSSTKTAVKGSEGVWRMWAYSNAGMLFQWGLGGALGLLLISRIWSVDKAFGIAMPAGFCGGHGTAAAMGDVFAQYGFEDMISIAMTFATVGVVTAVIVGLFMIKWGTNHGKTQFLNKYSELPEELRTGILHPNKEESFGKVSFSSISLDSLTFNFGIIVLITLIGYGISILVSHLCPKIVFPVFICAFVVSIVIKKMFDTKGLSKYISSKMIGHLSCSFTDYLIAFGIASIKIEVIWQLIVPIIITIFIGLILTYLFVIEVGKRIAGDYWFEKAIFTWGWFTGTMSLSIVLLRIVDPDMKSGCFDDYAYAYVYVAPLEIVLISLAPIAFYTGYGWLYVTVSLFGGTATLVFAHLKGWLNKSFNK